MPSARLDGQGGIAYMMVTMRLLLFLSAFLTALTGVATGGVAAVQPVQAEASCAPVRAHVAIVAAAPLPGQSRAFAASGGWHVAALELVGDRRASFGERRRE